MTIKEFLELGGYNTPVRLYFANLDEVRIYPNNPNDDAVYTPEIILSLSEEKVWLWKLINRPVAAWCVDKNVTNIFVASIK